MYVPGLRVEEVADMAAVTALIGRGKSNRSTFATNMNEHSSRSHLVLSVYVQATSKQSGERQQRGCVLLAVVPGLHGVC